MVPLHVKLTDLFVMEPGPYMLKSCEEDDDADYSPCKYLALSGMKEGKKYIALYHLTSIGHARWSALYWEHDDDWLAPEEQTTYKCWSIMHPFIDVAEHLE